MILTIWELDANGRALILRIPVAVGVVANRLIPISIISKEPVCALIEPSCVSCVRLCL